MEAEPAPEPALAVEDASRMSFLGHLVELRDCLKNSAIAVTVTTMIAYLFRRELFAIMARPLIQAWAKAEVEVGIGKPELVFTSPIEAFMVLLKLSVIVGIFAASPIIFREIWKFISPGLYKHERRYGLVFVVASVVLFVGGALFAFVFVLPASYHYFLSYSADAMGLIRDVMGKTVDVKLSMPFSIRPMITMDEYFSLTSTLLLIFGGAFELPLLLAILAIMGVVSAAQLWRWNRFAFPISYLLGAVLTPGDMLIATSAMAVSLMVLYNISILVAVVVGRKRRKVDEAADSEALEIVK